MEEVEVTGFESDGIDLISPLSSEFDSRADALSPPEMSDIAKDAKPYVVIVSNKTSRNIVAFTMALSNFEGKAMPNPLFYSYPPAAVEQQIFMAPNAVGSTGLDFGDRSEAGIPPGGQRLIGLGFSIPAMRPKFEAQPGVADWDDDRMWNWVVSTTREFVARIKSQGRGITGIRIKLDAVIFDNGLLIGPDTNDQLSSHLEGAVKARQDLYRMFVDSLDRGALIDELFPEPEEAANDLSDIFGFRLGAIATVNDLRRRNGDDKIRQVLQQAILKEPFVIHRK